MALLDIAQPKQWLLNVLVFAAPFVADQLTRSSVFVDCLVALVGFCLAASAVRFVDYVLGTQPAWNAAIGPRPRLRSAASDAGGAAEVPQAIAWICVLVLGLGALGVALAANPAAAGVIGIYLAMNLIQRLWLTATPPADLLAAAGGVLLRVMIGGAAAQIPTSPWLLLAVGFGALFALAAVHFSVLASAEAGGAASPETVSVNPAGGAYSASYLRFIWQSAVAVTILSYALWVFGLQVGHAAATWFEWSLAPWTLVFLRSALFADRGDAARPASLLRGDRALLVLGLVWIACLAAGAFSLG